jgi:hypothetical protein
VEELCRCAGSSVVYFRGSRSQEYAVQHRAGAGDAAVRCGADGVVGLVSLCGAGVLPEPDGRVKRYVQAFET